MPAPAIGPTTYIHWLVHVQPMRAGLRERAGFMDAPERVPAKMISRATVAPMAMAARLPRAFRVGGHGKDYQHQKKGQHHLESEGLGYVPTPGRFAPWLARLPSRARRTALARMPPAIWATT